MPPNAFSALLTPENLAPFVTFKERVVVFLHFIEPYSTVASLLLVTGIVYCFFRIEQIVHATKHEDEAHGGGHGGGGEDNPVQKRWDRVQTHLHSENESDWRLAVLEADVLLDEMVTHMGYHGDSLGEKLKGIEKSDFLTLDGAWEAHAVRNKIAHEGATFALTEREAKRVIKLYEEVFKEFHYI
ncbi:MAG: hypothetical protein Q7R64_01370 [bacterium]|nr:hypothetical protein [bacterium]